MSEPFLRPAGGDRLKIRSWGIAQVYAYLVCLAATITFTILTIDGLFGIARIAAPEYTMERYEFEQYRRAVRAETGDDGVEERIIRDSVAKPVGPLSSYRSPDRAMMPTPDDLVQAQKRHGFRSLIKMMISWIVCVPIFVLHFRWGNRLGRED